ncbi:MAG TPA: LPS assembly protein LptD [Acidobacteriaceae bacterium]|nr:LPS assembly protein LptD [Acidobacteriaceae bacterium]
MKTRLFWCITLYLLCHPQVWGQKVTSEFPPSPQASLPNDPSQQSTLPEAHVVPQPQSGVPVGISAHEQSAESVKEGTLWTLDGDAVIHYRNYIIHADHITYNDGTGEIVASGHMMIDGGPDDEHFTASHGTVNVEKNTGDFFDVVGTLGVERTPRGRMVFMAPNPFAITGREVRQLGKGRYEVIHGTMTSCRLPKPDWRILARYIRLENGVASTSGSWFELFHVPLLYLPYVTHPVAVQRSSGILIPYFGNDTTRGFIVGEGFYLTLGRSADLTMATQYWSKRGFAPDGMFRYRGLGRNFANVRFNSLLDHGLLEPNGARVNQGGVDVAADGRYDLTAHTRGVVDAEYLSSYVYRLVFQEDYAVAIDSEVKSQMFATHEDHDTWASLRMSRYQEFQSSTVAGDEVRILHLPQIGLDAADHSLGDSSLLWNFTGSAGALSRYDYPSFRTSAEVPRVDIYPRVSLPLHFGGWTFRPRAAVRETWYGRSQYPTSLEQIPVVRSEGTTRTDVETGFDLRPPAVERDFSAPWLRRLTGGDVRHVIEPAVEYRYVTGINNFREILRFDQTDVASDTNEIEYGLTQRFLVRNRTPHPCRSSETPTAPASESAPEENTEDVTDQTGNSSGLAEVMGWGINAAAPPGGTTAAAEAMPGWPPGALPMCGEQTRDWITWRIAQKYYFEPDFDHAITRGTPNPLDTTLDFTGVDFLTGPRNSSPVISRLRMQTTQATDLEWDLDYDVREGKITSSNVFAAFRRGLYRLQFGDAYMNVPLGVTPLSTLRVQAETPGTSNQYNQIHLSAIRGAANKLGLSEGLSAAYDLVHQQLQYGAAQAQYNWNCCGLDFQYRKFSLGSIRNDTEYFYSFNLAGLSNVGDLRRRISLF